MTAITSFEVRGPELQVVSLWTAHWSEWALGVLSSEGYPSATHRAMLCPDAAVGLDWTCVDVFATMVLVLIAAHPPGICPCLQPATLAARSVRASVASFHPS